MVDLSLLQDFIAETAEYLEEMEDILLRLEDNPGNRVMLDDILRSVHTIKGAAEYLGIERISRLSRAIENMLYHLLRQSELTVSPAVIDLLKDTQKRIALLIDNLHQTQSEEAEIDDLIERIQVTNSVDKTSEPPDQNALDEDNLNLSGDSAAGTINFGDDDENDEELFIIFLEQMEEKLRELQTQVSSLQEADNEARTAILDVCLNQIDSLSSSANYMGYEPLVSFYEEWAQKIQVSKEQLDSSNEDD
ncbi:MAG: Hpt domain-containing protein, partial [Deltaproteobacteria bacterium]|nr:Hpt domain-containing protein [Deltaproteobacteria bacterium]